MVAGQSCLRRGEPGGGLAITMGLGNGTHQTFRQLAEQLRVKQLEVQKRIVVSQPGSATGSGPTELER